MKKSIIFVIALLFLLTVFTACDTSASQIRLGNNFSNINLLCGACDDENYVYYIAKDKKIMRISKETGKLTDMGVSTHFLGTLSIVDGYLYLDAADYGHGDVVPITPCRINLNDIKDITYFDYETTNISSVREPVIVVNDTIYFAGGFQKINRDGTGGAAIDDHLYQVIGADNHSIYAYIISKDEIKEENQITKPMTWIYRLSPEWEIKQKLFQFCYDPKYALEDGAFSGVSVFPIMFGEYLYCVEPTKYDTEKYGFCDYILYRQRLSKNSEREVIVEFGNNYARILAVTDDGVYFYIEYIEETGTHVLSNIHRVNHDGTDLKELPYKYDVYNFDGDGYYFVSNTDGKLYCIIDNKILLVE